MFSTLANWPNRDPSLMRLGACARSEGPRHTVLVLFAEFPQLLPVGFQQQLRYLEKLMTKVDLKVPWERQLKQLDLVVPIGDLEAPESPLPIRDAIGSVMGEALEALEALVDKVQSQPQLLQKRELWKRQGMFFENMHKYKAIPGDAELLSRAKTAADRLRSLPNIFSDQLKGVKLALGVAKELEDWSKVAEKKLIKPVVVVEPVPVEGHPELNMVGAVETGEREKVKKDKKDKDKDGKDGKDKKSKKERKFEKKQKKADKKLAKSLAKIEKAASQAELMAKESREESDKAAKICAELDAEEAEAEFEERNAAAARRSETVVERKRDREGEGRGDSPRRKRARSSSSEDEESSED
ncbi:unnamed protein product [Polarella glacialis]|uniref:Uncharacterized protein n=1 Tax=Polarella glacialis TaxID=89957 RepID=A0A813HXB5_POLGL|nr:unnamed protein product [Polarella glacialis]